ncbi:MAG: aldehyde dehydrogenase family protein [Geminicoccaceae bacterium]
MRLSGCHQRQGYGLTFGLHTRIDDRVQQIVERIRVGNIYVNRNQIGAIVGSQPFGGEGLSGTGPKAGGPDYLARFCGARTIIEAGAHGGGKVIDSDTLQATMEKAGRADAEPVEILDLPGPTGESNRLSHFPRGIVLCLGPTAEAAELQADGAAGFGNVVIAIAEGLREDRRASDHARIHRLAGSLDPAALAEVANIAAVISWAADDRQRQPSKGARRAARPHRSAGSTRKMAAKCWSSNAISASTPQRRRQRVTCGQRSGLNDKQRDSRPARTIAARPVTPRSWSSRTSRAFPFR